MVFCGLALKHAMPAKRMVGMTATRIVGAPLVAMVSSRRVKNVMMATYPMAMSAPTGVCSLDAVTVSSRRVKPATMATNQMMTAALHASSPDAATALSNVA